MTKYKKSKFIRRGAVCLLTALLYSCSTPKDIAYFQDAAALNGMALQMEQQFRLRPEDKINIIVNSSNPLLEQQFTLTAKTSGNSSLGADVKPETTAGGVSGGNGMLLAYTVDEQGTIDFPLLGKIRVEGMTRGEVASYIKGRLVERELVSEPIVTVEYVNLSVNVLGEVGKPGNVPITKDHFTIVDALSRAGDMNINGNRRAVMVNRNVDGVNEVYYIDMTNMQQALLSPAYYLQQNDLVYVVPNNKKKRESTDMGNTFHSPYIWLSIASLLASLIAIFK
ncbi:MAG: polysaccharide biosynthesis/export family protein [Prevotella sp.]|nr:polysaccharide biosynthesis/export family protein [Prevotella sp.]